MNLLHRAYAYVENAERCWSDGDDQARKRAGLIVKALADAGLLVGAEIKGCKVVETESFVKVPRYPPKPPEDRPSIL